MSGVPGLEVSWLPGSAKDSEIDFVLTVGLNRIPVEVKYCGRLQPKDFAAIHSFCSQPKYNAPFGVVITRELLEVRDNVFCLPLFTLLGIR